MVKQFSCDDMDRCAMEVIEGCESCGIYQKWLKENGDEAQPILTC